MKTAHHPLLLPVASGVLFLLLLGIMFLYYLEYRESETFKAEFGRVSGELDMTTAEKSARIAELEAELASTTALLALTEEEREELSEDLEDKTEEVEEFGSQIKKISGTVGVLDKLAKTDPELLMKYSKVYFLNEHYIPEKITKIEKEYSAVPTDQYLESRVYAMLTDMIDDAKEDGIDLKVRSAYRSFESQKNLKSAYSVNYGSGANAFSADQGYSEHQLGTTVDLVSIESANQLAGFDTTQAYAWLQKNAHKYGFTLSYPKNNTFYIFEPWHWRYVGENLASDLHEDGKFFYDLDQREIDKYLVDVFD